MSLYISAAVVRLHYYLSHSYSIYHGTKYKIDLRPPCPSASTLTVAFLGRGMGKGEGRGGGKGRGEYGRQNLVT